VGKRPPHLPAQPALSSSAFMVKNLNIILKVDFWKIKAALGLIKDIKDQGLSYLSLVVF
jgi:hypothetical protein